MGELQNQWHKCRVFVGMKTSEAIPRILASLSTNNDSQGVQGNHNDCPWLLIFWRQRDQETLCVPFFYFPGYFRASGYPLSGSAHMVRIGRTSGRGLRGQYQDPAERADAQRLPFLPFSPSGLPLIGIFLVFGGASWYNTPIFWGIFDWRRYAALSARIVFTLWTLRP